MHFEFLREKRMERFVIKFEDIFSPLLVDCSGTNPCVNGGICENAACTCSSEYTGNLCGDGKIFEDVIIFFFFFFFFGGGGEYIHHFWNDYLY